MLLFVLPLSVGLPVLDHLLLRWVIDVVDLHEVLVHRFLLCPARLLQVHREGEKEGERSTRRERDAEREKQREKEQE
jgi:hypothetical protein